MSHLKGKSVELLRGKHWSQFLTHSGSAHNFPTLATPPPTVHTFPHCPPLTPWSWAAGKSFGRTRTLSPCHGRDHLSRDMSSSLWRVRTVKRRRPLRSWTVSKKNGYFKIMLYTRILYMQLMQVLQVHTTDDIQFVKCALTVPSIFILISNRQVQLDDDLPPG